MALPSLCLAAHRQDVVAFSCKSNPIKDVVDDGDEAVHNQERK